MKIGIFTDSHYSSAAVTCKKRFNSASLEKIAEAYRYFAAEGCGPVICLGDLIDREDDHQKEIQNLTAVSEIIRASGLHTVCVMGNHDAFAFTRDEFYSITGALCRPSLNITSSDGKILLFVNACYYASGEPYAPGKGKWIHLSLTWDAKAGKRKFYINGELQGEMRQSQFITPESISLGGPGAFSARSLVDEVRILRRVLTPAEIKQDYLAQMEGKRFVTPANKYSARHEQLFRPAKVTPPKDGLFIDSKEEFAAIAVNNDFTVDGDLNKKVWQEVKPLPYTFKTRSKGLDLNNKTIVKMRYSPSAIYFAFSLYQDMSKMVAKYDQDDQPIYADDCIEIFLDTPGEKGGFHQFVFNPLNSCIDIKDKDKKYTIRSRRSKVRRFKDRWDLEVKIPFRALGLTRPFAGDYIAARFCRAIRHTSIQESGALPRMRMWGNDSRISLAALRFVASSKESGVALSGKNQKFGLGFNALTVNVKNLQSQGFKGTIKLLKQERSGAVSQMAEKAITLDGKKSMAVKFDAVADSFDVAKLVFTANTARGEIASYVIYPDFTAPSESIRTLKKRIQGFYHTLAEQLQLDHPVYRGAAANLKYMSNEIAKFEARMKQTVAAKKALPGNEVKRMAELISGFQKYTNARRYIIWETSPWETGSPRAMPPADYSGNFKLDFKVAKNEREAKCFIISGLFCGSRLDLRFAPQSISHSRLRERFVSPDNFEIYQEKFMYNNGNIISAPLVRTPGNYITVTPGAPVRVWVMFNSKGLRIAPGNYKTRILVKHPYDPDINSSIPVSLRIWNFTLPETHKWPLKSFFWGANSFAYDEIAMLRMSHDYHITHGSTKSANYTHGLENDFKWKRLPQGVKFDENLVKTANQDFFRVAKELNMSFVYHWNVPTSARWIQLMAERMEKMGFKPEQYVFKALIKDEFYKRHIPIHADVRKEVTRISNNKWHFQAVYLSTPPPTGATMEDIEEAKLPEFYKMWMLIRHLTKDPKRGAETIKRLRAKGCQVWSYNCAIYMQTLHVLSYFRLYPWECYMMGLDGVGMYINISPKGDDGFDHGDGYDEGITLRGLDKIPNTTKRFEAFREGLEDVAYMDILKKELAAAPKGKFPQFQKLLDSREQIMKNNKQNEVDAWRDAVGEAINTLRKPKKK